MRVKIKFITGFLTGLMLMCTQAVHAADGSTESPFNNPLAITLMVLMLLLLIIIGVLANILLGTADFKIKKNKKETGGKSAITTVILFFLILTTTSLFAQDTETSKAVAKTIGGMSASTFYIMSAVIFLELFIIIALLINIKFLLKVEKEKVVSTEVETAEAKKDKLSWWDRFNKLKPVTEEAELDLGHEYDGIRELNNRLPPWWLYGFYASILFAVIYLWRFHVSHNGPSSKEEYERSVAKAELRIQEYLKKKGEAVDENTVTILTSPEDVAAGKTIFLKSCAACHKESGAGDVGPNLTDDYWMHGNDIKSIFKTIRYGINAMPQWQNQYSNKQIAQVASYIKTLHGTNPPNPKEPQGTLQKEEEPAAQPQTDSTMKENKIVMN